MRTTMLIIIMMMLIAGCSRLKDPVQQFIPGTYIRFSEHEFGKEFDTLVIKQQTGSTYSVLRKWKYERVVEGEKIEPEYKRTLTSAVYNSKYKLLQENEGGDIYSFDTRAKCLFNGPIKYQKL